MGALATWGAVAGGAKATKEHLVRKEEQEMKQENMAIEEARQMRLQKLRQEFQTGESEKDRTARQEEAEARREHDTGERTAGQKFKAGESEKQRQFEAVQKDKDIESREKIEAAKPGSKAGYKSIRLKTTTMGEDGFPTESEVPLVFQESTGQYFEDKAGKLVPYNLRENITEGERRLLDNPGSIETYLQTPQGKRFGPPKWYEMMYGDSYR